jgi:Lysyl oxidase
MTDTPGNRWHGSVIALPRAIVLCLLLCLLRFSCFSQIATIDDAWWTYQQDCNGDGCQSGTLTGDFERLNWNPDVTNCNGTLTVYEIVYSKPCASSTWTALSTNAPHSITGCRSSDSQSLDVQMASGCACWDYKIEICRNGHPQPDYVRSSTNDVDLFHHQEQLLAEDVCPNDDFAACVMLSGSYGSRAAHNIDATKQPGEPNHAGDPGGKSLWFCWTAPTNAAVTFDTIGSTFDTLVAVYTGNTISTLSLVASNDDIIPGQYVQSTLTFTPIQGTTYHIAVDGYGGASGIITLNWNQSGALVPGPDLIIWGPAASPSFITRTFSSNDCEVVEGCAAPGTHRLLIFTTETRNIGGGDLVIGNPATNSLFKWASCHGHYHFEQFADYTLLDTNGNVVAAGHKVGFCLEDVRAWSPTANPASRYNCGNQGIQSGWADVYAAGLPCQYIDITGLDPGHYNLRMVVNPAGLIVESNTNNNVTEVPVTIPVDCTSPASNDNFNSPTLLSGPPLSVSQYNACSSKESGEPNHAGNPGGHSVWFTWTPTSNQTAIVTTRRSDFDTLLAVYTGNTVSTLSLVASNDDLTSVIHQSAVSFDAFAGTAYRIVVDGYNGAVGTVMLNLNPPANDDFAAAIVVAGASGSTSSYTVGASKELGEPAHAFDVGGHSVWYRWVAPMSGPVEFNTAGSTFDTTLAIYTGTNVTSLSLVAANDDDTAAGLHTSRLSFDAEAGVTYQIAIDGYGGDFGNFNLNWNMVSQVSIAGITNGAFEIDFSGVNGRRYALLVSTDLVTWFTQVVRTMSDNSQQFIEGSPGPLRFYRTVLIP